MKQEMPQAFVNVRSLVIEDLVLYFLMIHQSSVDLIKYQ